MQEDTEAALDDREEQQVNQDDEDTVLPGQLHNYSLLKHYTYDQHLQPKKKDIIYYFDSNLQS